MSGSWFFLSGIMLGVGFLGGNWRFAWITTIASFTLALLSRHRENALQQGMPFAIPTPPRGTQSLAGTGLKEQEEGAEESRRDTVAFLKSDLGGFSPISPNRLMPSGSASPEPVREAQNRESRRLGQKALEEVIDTGILDGLALLQRAVSAGHTYAVFFPGKGEGLYLRAWITESTALIPGAEILSHQGLVGQLLKEGVKRVLEGEIRADSAQLHYYSSNEGIRSLVGVPITIKGARRGAVVVDSLREQAFDATTLEYMEAVANLIGQMAYHGYLAFEHSLHKEQLAALTNYQRKFLENMSVENIVTQVVHYMEECLEGDRFLVVSREPKPEQPDAAKVIRCVGEDAGHWEGFEFSLGEKGLVALAFEKEHLLNRSFTVGAGVPRLSPRERSSGRMASFLAVPVPTDQGVDMVLAVESARPRRFPEHHQNMLATIGRAAGFALARARLFQEKERLASRDGLTGVENHRTFQERFLNETLRAQRYGQQLAILMMDIDFFKKVNDTHGHPVGDQVLKQVARIISQNIRAGVDFMARYGGEEFVCMLADTDREKASETAERIRESVAGKVHEAGAVKFQVTLSIGGAIFPLDSRHGSEVLEKADKALYYAKDSGRNKLVFYN